MIQDESLFFFFFFKVVVVNVIGQLCWSFVVGMKRMVGCLWTLSV